MRKLCPNNDLEDGLETVLEIPMPEELFVCTKTKPWNNMKSYWSKPNATATATAAEANMTRLIGGRNAEIQLLLSVVGAPLIPLPVQPHHLNDSEHPIDKPIEMSMAQYIVKQYVAAVGGDKALKEIENMYAMGKVRMVVSEFCRGEGSLKKKKMVKARSLTSGGGEIGGFVMWQKGSSERSYLWCLELIVSDCKISAGGDGNVAWRQTPWNPNSHASCGPPRPLRRLLQGLDPKSTANLFARSVCIGEKKINDEDCFILKLEAEPSTLKARSSSNVEIIRHTVWGCFSQRTGLLIQLEDSNLLRINASGGDSIFWETTMESLIQDYRSIDGVQIAHAGKTSVSLFRFGENCDEHSRTRMEESWEIEEMDFNVKGLSMDCFLPPSDLKKIDESDSGLAANNAKLPMQIRSASLRISSTKILANVEEDESEAAQELQDT